MGSESKRKRDPRSPVRTEDPLGPVPHLWLVGGLILVTGLAYANSLTGDFVFDDQFLRAPLFQQIHSLTDALDFSGPRWLAFATFGLNVYFGGMNSVGYHVVNVAVHAANVVLVYLLLIQLGAGRKYPATAGALIFAVHPLFTEAVANVAGRFSVLCALFYFIAVLAFVRALDSEGRVRQAGWILVVAVSGTLGWYAKQEVMALPLALIGIYWVSRDRKNWAVLAPLALLPAGLLAYYREPLAGLLLEVQSDSLLTRVASDPVLAFPSFFRTYISSITGYYLPRFAVPLGLSADPHVSEAVGWLQPRFLIAVAVLSGMAWLILQGRRLDRRLAVGAVTLLLSPLTAYAFVPLADVVLEHRAYIPGLGIALLSGWAADLALRKYGRRTMLAVGVLAVSFSVATVHRNGVWQDSLSLWEATEAASGEKARPHVNLGQTYQLAGRTDDAVEEYAHALELRPDLPVAKSNLASLFIALGRLDDAETLLTEVTSEAPSFTDAWVHLGTLHMRRLEFDEGLEAFDRALALDPSSSFALVNKANALTETGDFEGALEHFRRAMALRPDVMEFRMDLALAYYRSGDHEAAERELLSLKDTDLAADAYRNLGVLSTDSGELESALTYLQESLRIRPDRSVRNAVGSTYLKLDMPDAAIETLRAGIEDDPEYGPFAINLALAYERTQEFDSAREVLSDFLEINPGSPYAGEARNRLDALD